MNFIRGRGSRGQGTNINFPVFTTICIVANFVIFGILMKVNNCKENNPGIFGDCLASFLGRFSFQPYLENPLIGPSSEGLGKMGVLDWVSVVLAHKVWRLLACIWLHAGVIHLLFTSLCVAFIGIRIEQQYGSARMAFIYIMSGFGGSVLYCLFHRSVTTVGASGAVCGLAGAKLSELVTNWKMSSDKVPTMFILFGIITFNLCLGFLPFLDNYHHMGGLVVGCLLGFILLARPSYRQRLEKRQYILGIISLILMIVGLSVGLLMLFRGYNVYQHCRWCHYLACYPDYYCN